MGRGANANVWKEFPIGTIVLRMKPWK